MSCSSDEQSDKECPLCMELLEIDDVDFYPCKCEYQICRFCWHRLKNDENGLCPACRQPYPEDPVNFKPLSTADLQRIKDEKKLKAQAEKMRISESRKHLANYRVLQKNLLYVVGLSTRFANEEVLRKAEFFGKFGKILKIVLGTSPATNLPAHLQPSHTAYITYNKVDEALKAIQGVNNSILDGRTIKASLGTTKYCSSFLRSQTCGKPECMYLHDTADNDISFTKEDMHAGKHSDYERRLIEAMIIKRQALEKRQAANPNSKADQNGVDIIDDTQETSDEIYTNGLSSGSPASDRHDSLEKENLERPSKKITPPSRRHSPPTTDQDHDSSYSSMNGECGSEPQRLDRAISKERVSLDAPPGLIAPPGLTHSSSTHSISENTSRLLKLMNLSEGSGTGLVPAPALQEEAPAPLANWQTLLGLTPSEPKKILSTKRISSPPLGLSALLDDDLGFDPFSESTKGLAALLEEERVDRHRNPPSFLSNQQSAGHRSLSDLWGVPSMGSATSNGVQQSRSHTSFSGAPFDMFSLNSQSNHMGANYSNGYHPPVPPMYSDYGPHHQPSQQQQAQQQYGLHKQQMPNFAPPPGLSAPRQQQGQPQSIAEWQEGLKKINFQALLPNVNVRFSSDFEQQANQRWSGIPQPNGYAMHQMMSQHHHSVPPPPGFSIQNR